jgi:hypothetical protein
MAHREVARECNAPSSLLLHRLIAEANMSSLLVPFAVLAIIVGLIAYGYWWHNHGDGKRQRDRVNQESKDRAALVHARGWRYEVPESGDIKYRIHGRTPSGLAWELYYDSDHSSSSSTPKLKILVPELGRQKWMWAINDRPTFDVVQKKAVKAIISGIAGAASLFSDKMKEKTAFFNNAKAQNAGSQAFQARYVLVSDNTRWNSLIDADVERAILHWPAYKGSMSRPDICLSAELGPGGLEVKLYVDGPSMEVIDQIVTLGERLADKARMML